MKVKKKLHSAVPEARDSGMPVPYWMAGISRIPPMLVAPQRKPTTTKLTVRNIVITALPDRMFRQPVRSDCRRCADPHVPFCTLLRNFAVPVSALFVPFTRYILQYIGITYKKIFPATAAFRHETCSCCKNTTKAL